jgi:general secretion pathway protein F
MSAYHFTAVNHAGLEQKGVIEAESEKHARQLLRDRALIPIKLRDAKGKKVTSKENIFAKFLNPNKLSSKEIAIFTRQFATLLSAGLPMEESLLAVSEQTEKPHLKGLILAVRGKVLEGHSLAAALNEHPDAFTPLFTATIAAGERSGYLDKVLLRLADYTEQQWNIRQKLRTALIYPVMIVVVALAIVGFLLAYVVPKMVAVYSHLHQTLPLLTRILIAISGLVQSYGLILVGLIIVGIYFWRQALKKSAPLREKFHHFLLRLPLIGYAIRTADTARFARTLAILSTAGVPVVEAMGISAKLIGNIPIRRAVEDAVNHVREGASIQLSLKQTTYFPPMSVHMIASGEASGQLENMLERVAQTQESEIIRLIDVSLALFEPAIILIMGAIVLFIVLAVLLPIFDLNQFAG